MSLVICKFHIPDVKISKRLVHSAAVNVINSHKASIEEVHSTKNYNFDCKFCCFLRLASIFT